MGYFVAPGCRAPLACNLGLKLFARDILGLVKAEVIMALDRSRTLIDGKATHAQPLLHAALAEQRSVQAVSKMPEVLTGSDRIEGCVGTIF